MNDALRRAAIRKMSWGGGIFVLGVVITVGSFLAAPGGHFIFTWGFIIVGGIRFVQGLMMYMGMSSGGGGGSYRSRYSQQQQPYGSFQPNTLQPLSGQQQPGQQPYGAFQTQQPAQQQQQQQPAQQQQKAQAPAGASWFPDPSKRHELRYWDGSSWTGHVSNQGVVSQDPVKR